MIRIEDTTFKDEHGRAVMLRGVNLSGSSKVPRRPDGATHLNEGFFDHRSVSFVDRPFPLGEADEHLARLRSWGFNLVRLLVTWEAIEHTGPGVLDTDYLSYIREVVRRAAHHGLLVLVDPHQDMWSRFTGGDGAPGWTLEAAGFDLRNLDATGAAIRHQVHGDPLPQMIWPTNSGKLATATMFTLFFGGNDFAPRTLVEGERIQEFLQRHYIAAIAALARALSDLPNILGYANINEPLAGYIGWKDLNASGGILTLGEGPTPFQGMLLASGLAQDVWIWKMGLASIRKWRTVRLNTAGQRAWREGFRCPWQANGVWDVAKSGAPVLLRPNHFTDVDGRTVDFQKDYYQPFTRRFYHEIHEADPRAFLFLEAVGGRGLPLWDPHDREGVVFSPHWYDDLLLLKKRFMSFAGVDSDSYRVIIGKRAVRKSFHDQLARLKRHAVQHLGGVPTVLTEFGIPYDMGRRRAFRTGDFSIHARALDRSFRAIEANLMDCAIWNYTPDNSNARGDQWNGEDLSIFSRDQQGDPGDINSGGRALEALLRPYPRAVAGKVLSMSFDLRRRIFTIRFQHDPRATAPTELYVPGLQYPSGCTVRASDGTWELQPACQTLLYRHGTELSEHWITLSPRG